MIKNIKIIVTLIFVMVMIGCNSSSNNDENTNSPDPLITGTVDLQEQEDTGIDAINEDSEQNTEEADSEKDLEENEEKNIEENIEENIENTDIQEEIINTSKRSMTIDYQLIYFEDFESGDSGFAPRAGETVEIIDYDAFEGNASLKASNRTATWHGASIDLSDYMTDRKRFDIDVWVKFEGEAESATIRCMVQQNDSNYLNFGSAVAKIGEWVNLTGSIEIPTGTHSAMVYFETQYRDNPLPEHLVDIYVDNMTIKEVIIEGEDIELPRLFEAHEGRFSVGVGVENFDLQSPERAELVITHFNSMTMGNEMKPDYILDYEANSRNPEKHNLDPAIRTDLMDVGLKFAQENNIPMRGHTLVWHSQTPRWFFTENYSNEPDAPLVSREVMIARLENYIKNVLTYCQENFSGVVYCWDVVNEAIAPADGQEGGFRSTDSLWFEVIGSEFVELAFTYARKYADPDVKLFYNDYNEWDRSKLIYITEMLSDFYEKGIVDGMGMQSHLGVDSPSVLDYQYAITKYAEIGLEIHITEIDISLASNSEEDLMKLATRYKRLVNMYRHMVDNDLANITNVTIWGLSDDRSWLNKDGRRFPLLFDAFLLPKDAFWGFYFDDSIPLI